MAVIPFRTPRRLTDEELLNTEFRFEDPEGIPGLNLGVPDPEAQPTIIGYYDLTPPGGRRANPDFPYVRCCHCGKRRHWDGRVVRDDRGSIHIIGAKGCGRAHYGDRYVNAEREFRDEQVRRSALRRWRAMLPLSTAYAQECEALLASPALATLELKAQEIRRAAPAGFELLARHAISGQELHAHWQERDVAKEAERDRKFEEAMATYRHLPRAIQKDWQANGMVPEREDGPIYTPVSQSYGHLVGAGFLTDSGDVRSKALALREALRAIADIERRGTGDVSSKELGKRIREMTDRPRDLQAALIEASAAPLFFAADNLDRMAGWSAREHRYNYRRDGSSLVVEDPSRGRTSIAPLQKVDLPECPALRNAHRLDEDFTPLLVQAA